MPMSVVRQRFFVRHDDSRQQDITEEYTIQSHKDGLANLFFLYEKFLPNLLVVDGSGSILPVNPSRSVIALLTNRASQSTGAEQKRMKSLISMIQARRLFIVWVKIPKRLELASEEVRTVTISYSAHRPAKPGARLSLKTKRYAHPVYYTLYSPEDFDFAEAKYGHERGGEGSWKSPAPLPTPWSSS